MTLLAKFLRLLEWVEAGQTEIESVRVRLRQDPVSQAFLTAAALYGFSLGLGYSTPVAAVVASLGMLAVY
ncbi:MAG: hypothetical protein AAFQ61_08215 [Cyanobacteria bacterium J06626_23]